MVQESGNQASDPSLSLWCGFAQIPTFPGLHFHFFHLTAITDFLHSLILPSDHVSAGLPDLNFMLSYIQIIQLPSMGNIIMKIRKSWKPPPSMKIRRSSFPPANSRSVSTHTLYLERKTREWSANSLGRNLCSPCGPRAPLGPGGPGIPSSPFSWYAS